MPKTIARTGDLLSHGGRIVGGSSKGTAHGKAIARIGDLVVCTKHGMQKIVQGSSKATLDKKAIALSGDQCSCGAILLPNPEEKSLVTA